MQLRRAAQPVRRRRERPAGARVAIARRRRPGLRHQVLRIENLQRVLAAVRVVVGHIPRRPQRRPVVNRRQNRPRRRVLETRVPDRARVCIRPRAVRPRQREPVKVHLPRVARCLPHDRARHPHRHPGRPWRPIGHRELLPDPIPAAGREMRALRHRHRRRPVLIRPAEELHQEHPVRPIRQPRPHRRHHIAFQRVHPPRHPRHPLRRHVPRIHDRQRLVPLLRRAVHHKPRVRSTQPLPVRQRPALVQLVCVPRRPILEPRIVQQPRHRAGRANHSLRGVVEVNRAAKPRVGARNRAHGARPISIGGRHTGSRQIGPDAGGRIGREVRAFKSGQHVGPGGIEIL